VWRHAAFDEEDFMEGSLFDAFTRRAAAAATRRLSFLTLGASALGAAIAGSSLVQAGKAGKKAKKKCKRQRGQCEEFFATDFCVHRTAAAREDVSAEGPVSCVDIFRPCCDLFAQCKAGEALSCINEKVIEI
jgi:hypothetical protein